MKKEIRTTEETLASAIIHSVGMMGLAVSTDREEIWKSSVKRIQLLVTAIPVDTEIPTEACFTVLEK
tara:strand:+ start:54 stop:254 length:201 start_codon:yes stop_codon:yes gene_type:complete